MRRIDLSKRNSDVLVEYQKELKNGFYDEIKDKYKDPATAYCFRVLNNEVLTCKSIKLQAFRHLQDLRRSEDNKFPYYYSLDEAKKIVNFSRLLTDPSTNEHMDLLDWQFNILLQANAWLNKETGERRYNRVICSMARTNGKSMLATVQILYDYLFRCMGLTNQENLLALPNQTQVDKVWNYIISYLKALEQYPFFRKYFKKNQIDPLSDFVVARKSLNRILKRPFLSKRFDSLHIKTAVLDEVADSENQQVISESIGKITSGMVQVADPLVFMISTAYPDSNCDFYKQEKNMINAMERDFERKRDNVLCIVYQQESEEETNDISTWIKSNPLLELDELHDRMIKQMEDELADKRANNKEYEFINKNMNRWLNRSINNFLDLDDIENSVVKEEPIDIMGRDCFVGMDLSNFSDDTSLSFVFPYQDKKGNKKWFIKEHSFIPTARAKCRIDLKETQDNINYRGMEDKGYCSITANEQGYINYDEVFEYLMQFIDEHELNVKALVYDAWRSDELILRLEQNTNLNLVPLQQTVKFLNDPTKDFQKQMSAGAITYEPDEILMTALKNAILLEKDGFVKVDKNRATKKIDVCDSIIDAFYRARFYFDDISFNDNKKSVFGDMSQKEINDYFTNNFSF